MSISLKPLKNKNIVYYIVGFSLLILLILGIVPLILIAIGFFSAQYIDKSGILKKTCMNCETSLPLLSVISGKQICGECEQANLQELKELHDSILNARKITKKQIEALQAHPRGSIISLYTNLFNNFETDKELDETEINLLNKIQETFSLTNEEIKFNQTLRPYIYIHCLRIENKLPTLTVALDSGHLVLKKAEIVHFADTVILKEIKSVSLGYKGGSHGISIPITKGIRYRVGSHRGKIMREERLVETSRGALCVTNQRLFLHPAPGVKPLSIPLKKILSYHCYENGLEVFKEGREKGYFFEIADSGSAELFGICLEFLLSQ